MPPHRLGDKADLIEVVSAYTLRHAPNRFLPALCAGVAFQLALKRAPDRIQALKLLYEDTLQRALTEDGTRTSAYISPQAYYPSVS